MVCQPIPSAAGRNIAVAPNQEVPYNNALHQTGREGAAGFLRRRPVVEARPAGERGCCTDRRTDRKILVPQPSAVAETPPCYRAQTAKHGRRWSGPSEASAFSRKSLEHLPTSCRPALDRPLFHRHPRGSTSVIKQLIRSFTIGTSRLGGARPSNKGLEQMRRVGVPASRAVIRVSPHSSTQC